MILPKTGLDELDNFRVDAENEKPSQKWHLLVSLIGGGMKYKVLIGVLLVFGLMIFGVKLVLNNEIVKADELTCTYLRGSNKNRQNYQISPWTPGCSYLVPVESGYMRVQGDYSSFFDDENVESVVVYYYDFEYNLTNKLELPTELARFGGFIASDSAYFIVTGQTNYDERDDVEVFRVTKYDKNWNRIGSCGLFGANTTIPFRSGSCRMDMDGQYLIIRTSHQMYKSSDGRRHQANVSIEVDTSSMHIKDSKTLVSSWIGYVSHSFNQFIKTDDRSLVSIDHGDGYPRAIRLNKYYFDNSDGESINVMEFPGEVGDNCTGASVGGFEIADYNYLVAGNSVVQDKKNTKRKTRNIFVATIDKSDNKVNINWLTNYPEGEETVSTPHMVKLSNDSFMILWSRGKVYYTLIDGYGNKVSDIYCFDGCLSDCEPIATKDKVIWYTWDNREEKFYEISLSSLDASCVKTTIYEHDYELQSVENGVASLKCRKCGNIITGDVVSKFRIYWKKSQEYASYFSWAFLDDIEKNEGISFLTDLPEHYNNFDDINFNELVIESDDPENCVIDIKKRKIKFISDGKYTIKAYLKYNPKIEESYVVEVYSKKLGRNKATVISRITEEKNSFTVEWKKVKGIDGYEIRYSKSKKMKSYSKIKIDNAEITSQKITDFIGGETYYVKIRTYKETNGKKKFSKWSKAKAVVTQK